MNTTAASTAWIEQLKLRTIDPDREARVAIASVPVPESPGEHALVTFGGLASQAVPIAWYPGPNGPGRPRQALMLGISQKSLADELAVTAAAPANVVNVASPHRAQAADPAWRGPRWEVTVVEEKKTGMLMRESNELVLAHDGRRLGLRMGIELTGGGYHWWEWVSAEQLWTGPICTAIRVAGYIPIQVVDEEELFDSKKYNAGFWLHRHNWLFAEVYAQLFTNGLVRVTARHVNNRFFDQGRDLEGFVPVLGFTTTESGIPLLGGDVPGSRSSGTGVGSTTQRAFNPPLHPSGGGDLTTVKLDGTRTDFALGSVQLDVERGTDIVSVEHPGQLRRDGDQVIYQPYEGAEFLLGDGQPTDRWKVQAQERRMWKGMARSFGFDLSFADQPIRTRRYLPPYGWQAYAGALWPDRLLPARGPMESVCDRMIGQAHFGQERKDAKTFCSGRYFQASSMWDGEHAHGWMRHAYRTLRRDCYEAALHHAYAYADVGMDHADFTHQIVDMPKGSISLVLQRNLGMLAAYLETGDPYLLRCAESMADVAYAIDRSNWPRRSFGRDSAYIRSLTRLYDVTGQAFYLQRAGEACRRVTQCQRPNGSYADQGGTTGPHSHLNEIIKPWMNSILSEVFVDYLERAGHDPVVEAALIRTADWLLSAMLEDANGRYWPYQVAWGQNEIDPAAKWYKVPQPGRHPVGDVHLDYNARTLLWVSRRTGDPRYARAWESSYQRFYVKLGRPCSTYGEVKVPDNFPWHEAHLWGAQWDGRQVAFAPQLDLMEIGREATIELPDGRSVRVKRTAQGVEVQ